MRQRPGQMRQRPRVNETAPGANETAPAANETAPGANETVLGMDETAGSGTDSTGIGRDSACNGKSKGDFTLKTMMEIHSSKNYNGDNCCANEIRWYNGLSVCSESGQLMVQTLAESFQRLQKWYVLLQYPECPCK